MKRYSRQHFPILTLLFSLSVSADNTEEVEVTGKKTETVTETLTGFEVEAIKAEQFYDLSADVNDIIAFSPGVIIRETGGLGSQFDLAINGLSGDQIRYFFDGIPMENFGDTLRLNNFPVNLIEGVEIFKGVVPIRLSSDALGGAINITTPDLSEKRFDVSYSAGSFNTHRLALFAQNANDDGVFWRINSFFNYSDNDYEMDNISVTDELGNINGKGAFKRFHDVYRSSMINLKSGLIDKDYADELSLSVTAGRNYDEIQHPDLSVDPVIGASYSEDETILLSSIYRKQFTDLAITAYGLIGQSEKTTYNTKNRVYKWDGSYRERTDTRSGEVGLKSIFALKDEYKRLSLGASYNFSPTQTSLVNISSDSTTRSGKDHIRLSSTFNTPNKVQKHVIGLSHESIFLDDFISTSVFIKRLFYKADVDVNTQVISGDSREALTSKDNATGYGFTSRFDISNNLSLTGSYEKSFRLPNSNELLGDGRFLRSNASLEKEESKNTNLGLVYSYSNSLISITVDTNLFHRKASNYILPKPVNLIFSQFQNLTDVSVKGIEFAISMDWQSTLFLDFNATYQDIINKSRKENGSPGQNFGERTPNQPYLFANLRAGYETDLANGARVSTYWKTHYVDEYFHTWKGDGRPGSKFTIDKQFSHDLDITYTFANSKFSANLTLSNLFDDELFDRFDIQKPGRAYFLKLRYAM